MTELSREEVLRVAGKPVLCVSGDAMRRVNAADVPVKAWLPPLTTVEDTALYTEAQLLAIYEAGIKKGKSIPMKYRRMEFNAQLQDELAAERAVSDKLLEALNIISNNGPADDMDGNYIIADEAIAEVEAMRKEKPE